MMATDHKEDTAAVLIKKNLERISFSYLLKLRISENIALSWT